MRRKLLSSSFASFVIGDLATTYIGLYLYPSQIIESNPFPAYLISEFGLMSLIPFKLLAFGILYAIYKLTPNPHDIGVPIGLTTLGIIITLWNSYLLLSL